MPAKEFINIVYDNIFCFLQDFIALSLDSKILSGRKIVVTNDETGKKRKFRVGILKSALS